MARTKATGLIMPRPQPEAPLIMEPWQPWTTQTGTLVPGVTGQTDTLESTGGADDETDYTYGGYELGVIAIPAFPKEGRSYKLGGALAPQFSTYPRVPYTQASPKYFQVLLPGLLGDDATGLPEEDHEYASVSASDSIKYLRGPISFAFGRTNLAHEVNQVMGDNDTSATGATGVWSVAGRA